MTELFLNDQAVDLAKGTVIAQNKQINDISELQNRQTDVTNRINIPFTLNNSKIFETVEETVSGTLVPYRRFKARIRVSGVDTVPDGLGILETISGGNYVLSVLSGVFDFFDTLGDKSLQDLDLSSFDHLFNKTTVVNSQTNTTGFIYAIADYGDLPDTTRTIDIRRQGMSFFVRSLVDQIFTEAGFTKSGAIFSNQQYLDLILPFTAEEIRSVGLTFAAQAENKNITSYPTTIPIDDEISDPGDNYNPVTFKWIAPRALTGITFVCSGQVQIDANSITMEIFSSVGGVLDTQTISTTGSNQPFSLDTGVITLANAEEITVRVDSGFTPTTDVRLAFFSNIPAEGFEAEITVAEMMPKVKQRDLIQAITNIFGLVPLFDITDPLNVDFKQFQDLFTEARVIDWSDKLDLSKPIETEFARGSYAKKNNLIWKEDPRNLPDNLGNGSFAIDDDNLPTEADVIKIPFAPSEQTVKILGVNLARIKRYTDPEASGTWNLTEKIKERIAVVRVVNKGSSGTFDITDGTTTSNLDNIAVVRFFDSGDLDELDGDTILNEHYPGLIASLARTKIKKAFFRLDAKDIHDLDHFIPVYVQKFGARFYVNKIVNYIEGISTKCELFRL